MIREINNFFCHDFKSSDYMNIKFVLFHLHDVHPKPSRAHHRPKELTMNDFHLLFRSHNITLHNTKHF